MAQSRSSNQHPHAHHHHPHITDPSRRRKKHHLPTNKNHAHLIEDDESSNNFISSSRDASEEDNDDQETFDDSASALSVASLRTAAPTSSDSTKDFPTSARDRALVDSKPTQPTTTNTSSSSSSSSHPHPLSQSIRKSLGNSPNADKTPSSSSPPKSSIHPTSQRHGASGGHHLGASATHSHVASTLTEASAALSRSSSAELIPKAAIGSHSPLGPNVPLPASAAAAKAALDLGSLPPPPTAGTGIQSGPLGNLAAATPKASSQHESNSKALGLQVATSSLARDSGDGDDTEGAGTGTGGETDGGEGGTPYDGDVEFAARPPVSSSQSAAAGAGHTSSLASAPIQGTGSANAASSSSAANSALMITAMGTAAPQVPSKSYHDLVDPKTVREEREPLEERGSLPVPSASEIREWVHSAIYQPDPKRDYSINLPPPADANGRTRPIRIYADGVYDLFHYAHALQLRQAKLSFPSVHLIVGVVSSSSCAHHKNQPVLSSAERYECVRNCRWVDEVLEDAPWVIDQETIDKLEIDYVAHDELPYGSAGHEDVYDFVKKQGRFLPTRRTEGVSTSELLARVVKMYRGHGLDGKLEKMGCKDLTFEH
ncbi:hypothetical protein IE53DRAFT_390855 [Violaceomyces palustris]|uniref:Uncharacterized protein n=1 Tax=Violaceomyces palustris TaxID=1673888 RepID=A0ACD0NML1_9BASI|nr:hypothetical protein IE53DRAFT_390855 [Violaceomyces palustris]